MQPQIQYGETSGSNGGNVTLILTNQEIEGDFVVDSGSSLTINMINSSIKGKINTDNASKNVVVNLDAASSIVLTRNTYITTLTNSNSNGSNISKGSYIFQDNNGNNWAATGSEETINKFVNSSLNNLYITKFIYILFVLSVLF